MKIVIDARESGTGTGRYIDKLIEHLHKLRPPFELVILTKPHRTKFMKAIAPSFEVTESNFKEFTFAEQIGFLKQLKSLGGDLVHFGMTQQPVLYHGRSITTIHDLTTARFTNPIKNWPVFKFKQLIYRFVIKRVAKKANRIIAPSQFVKHDIAQFTNVPESKITVTYEAGDTITTAAQSFTPLKDKLFIMYVGRAQPHKNLERLVEAFAKLKSDHPKLSLILVGKLDDNYRLLQKYVAKKAIKNVVFTGYVSDGELRWLYENAKAYVFPSLSEGFGLPALEALAHGLPLVSSNATCLPEIYGDAAIYFDPSNADDIAQKIKIVLDSSEIAKKMRETGPKQAAKYSWERMAKQTQAVYLEVLAVSS